MKLKFMMNVFNDALTIGKAIESIYDVADEIHVFDGAYKQFPHKNPSSSDKTLEIASSFPAGKVQIHTCFNAYESQVEKRTHMFSYFGEGDMLFKLDGDEWVANPDQIVKVLKLDPLPDVVWGWTLSNVYARPYMTARMFKWREGMHYAGRHHWLYTKDQKLITSDQNMNPRFKHRDTPIRIFNLRHARSLQRQNHKVEFIKERSIDELKFLTENKVYPRFNRLVPHPNRAPSPRPVSRVIRFCTKPKYTYTALISRPWAVDRYLAHLSKMEFPKNIEAVVVVDTKDEEMYEKIVQHFREDRRFMGVTIYKTNEDKLPEYEKVSFRRRRIISNWHILLTEAKGDYILSGEDDSLPDRDAYIKLLDIMEKQKADFVQGNIIGRWATKLCPAWKVKEIKGKPVKVWNAEEQATGIEDVQGMGWYCFVADIDVIRKLPMRVDGDMPLGPDVNLGYRLWKEGYKLLHSWDVKVRHFGEDFDLYPGHTPTEQKIWLKRATVWVTKDFDKKYLDE